MPVLCWPQQQWARTPKVGLHSGTHTRLMRTMLVRGRGFHSVPAWLTKRHVGSRRAHGKHTIAGTNTLFFDHRLDMYLMFICAATSQAHLQLAMLLLACLVLVHLPDHDTHAVTHTATHTCACGRRLQHPARCICRHAGSCSRSCTHSTNAHSRKPSHTATHTPTQHYSAHPHAHTAPHLGACSTYTTRPSRWRAVRPMRWFWRVGDAEAS